jgi:CxxC-x17-CxxC domain-containing protein
VIVAILSAMAKQGVCLVEDFQDITLACRDCGEEFVFTAGEQRFYQEKGFTNRPTRCTSCRSANKARRDSGGGYSSGGGGGYGGGGGGGRMGGGEREFFDAVCAECGRPTRVPFQPRGDRPVYCSDCFASRRQSYSRY